MKTINIVCTTIIGLFFGFILGIIVNKKNNEQVYNDACRMSDAIRCYLDDINNPQTEVQDNGTFKEICDMFLWNDTIENRIVPLEDYAYCY